MRVYPVNNVNTVSTKGSLDRKTKDLFKNTSRAWLNEADMIESPSLKQMCLYVSESIDNVFINLSIMMERFGHACRLTFAKSEKNSNNYRFYIDNQYSNYKLILEDIEFSEKVNKQDDVKKIKNLENSLAKIDPYKENSNFIIQRKAQFKAISYDSEFEPDTDCVFIEDKLVGKEPAKELTMEDIKEYLEEAKREGLI